MFLYVHILCFYIEAKATSFTRPDCANEVIKLYKSCAMPRNEEESKENLWEMKTFLKYARQNSVKQHKVLQTHRRTSHYPWRFPSPPAPSTHQDLSDSQGPTRVLDAIGRNVKRDKLFKYLIEVIDGSDLICWREGWCEGVNESVSKRVSEWVRAWVRAWVSEWVSE